MKKVDGEGTTRWYNEKGQIHREDGPAVECLNGTKHWFRNGKRHREDGPATEWSDGIGFWYIYGKEFTQEEFESLFSIQNDDLFERIRSLSLSEKKDIVLRTLKLSEELGELSEAVLKNQKASGNGI
jgi:hypothetical protein